MCVVWSDTLVHGGSGGGEEVSCKVIDSGVLMMVRASLIFFCNAGLDVALLMYFRAIVSWRCLIVWIPVIWWM